MKNYVTVAVSGPTRKVFTYHTDDETLATLSPGAMVSVPFGRKRVRGFFLGETGPPRFQTKPIGSRLDTNPPYSKKKFEFYLWLAEYYFANPADVLSLTAAPAGRSAKDIDIFLRPQADPEALQSIPERIQRRLLAGKRLTVRDTIDIQQVCAGGVGRLLKIGALEERISSRATNGRRLLGYRIHQPQMALEGLAEDSHATLHTDGIVSRARLKQAGMGAKRLAALIHERALEPVYSDPVSDLLSSMPLPRDVKHLTLNREQKTAVESVTASVGKSFETFLLHGVTGSGKSLVYCHLIAKALELGRAALVLAPEIVLAGGLHSYLTGFLDTQVGLWHSGLSAPQRNDLWRKLRSGEIRVLVGPRSALFAPLADPGIIIVDEEHAETYKQDDPSPRFQGRDAAVMLARKLNIPIVLGSGTPSVESFHNAQTGRYTLLTLTRRPSGAPQPKITLVDMNKERLAGDFPFVSFALKREVDRRIDNDEQVILYLNRRGFSPRVRCRECGHIPHCPDCHSALTFHKRGARLLCHLCGFTRAGYESCESCDSKDLLHQGAGTQKLEESVLTLFPRAKGVRLDSDVAGGKNAAWRILRGFADGDHNLLIGTQMISKGLDLPNVTLVGALMSDAEAGLVDFRANEKTFSKLTQVAGRCGRAEKSGLALAQTYNPQSQLMQSIASGNYQAFYENEISDRQTLDYPPFSHVIRIILQAPDEEKLAGVALTFRGKLEKEFAGAKLRYRILGPAPCQIHRLRGRYRRHLLLFTKTPQKLTNALTEWENRKSRLGLPSTVKFAVDVDPYDFM